MSDYDPILAAIQATKYADAVMRRTAGEISPEDAANLHDPNKAVRIPLDDPHTDWRPRWGDRSTTEKWHPPYGETHVKYHVYQVGGGRNPTLWRANHHGTYEGMQTLSPPNGSGEDLTFPNYTMSADPEPVGEGRNFRNPKDAKAAAERHYRENYGTPPKHDYDIDSIMDKHPQAPSGGKRGLGDDEDYGHIFGMHARYAAAISGVSDAVRQRIAAELSPPCPDCGQVAGFDEHMVSPRVKVCRNCEYPMTDIGHDDLLEGILRGHDKAVGDLPETDHPSLGRHGQLDYDDVMKRARNY